MLVIHFKEPVREKKHTKHIGLVLQRYSKSFFGGERVRRIYVRPFSVKLHHACPFKVLFELFSEVFFFFFMLRATKKETT